MEEGQVEFDMSFSTNSRINFLLWTCNESSKNDEVMEWFKALKNMYKEAYVSMTKDEEKKQHKDMLKKCEKSLNDYNDYMLSYNKNTPFQPPREVYDNLFDWELQLRNKLNKMGLLFKQKDDFAL